MAKNMTHLLLMLKPNTSLHSDKESDVTFLHLSFFVQPVNDQNRGKQTDR